MPQHRLAPQAETELDEIWLYAAHESGSVEIADRLLDSIIEHFLLLARNPYLGRRRDSDLRPGLRSFSVGEYVILYRVESAKAVLILRVLHGRRDLPALLKS